MKILNAEGFPLQYEKQDRGSPSCADVKLLYDSFERRNVEDLKTIRETLINRDAGSKEFKKLAKDQQKEAKMRLIAVINYFLLKEGHYGKKEGT